METKPESQQAAEEYARLNNIAGSLSFQIDMLSCELAEVHMKMRNANVAYQKAKKAETKAHPVEATQSEEVTNEAQH